MKKTIVNALVLFVVIASIFTFINIVSVDRAEAVSCPEGLVCTAVNSVVVCPVGYTCTPTPICPAGYICKPIEIQPTTCPPGYICKLTNNGGGSSGNSGGSGGSVSNRCYRFETNLSVGSFWTGKSKGADVVALQTLLIAKGFDIPSISSGGASKGVFGAETKSALMRYQASVGIPATGVADPQTRVALNSLCGSTNSPSITVLSPNGGESYTQGSQMRVKWQTSNTTPGGTIWIHLDTLDGKHLDNGDLVKSWVPNTGEKIIAIPSNIPAGRYKVAVTVGRELEDVSDGYITIGGSTPAPTPYSTPKPVISYVKPSSNNEARFIGTGYEIYPNDLIDVVGTNLSGKGGIDIYVNGRVCKAESLTTEKITCQVPLESIVEGGTYELYARTDDGIRSNTILVTVKNRVLSVVPSVKVMSPNTGEIWSIGDKKTITWSYANWNSGIFGNKYVDMYLVPMDGRSPIKLATNFNSPDGTVSVTIHEKTSDGRSAWLPGRYKIRVVCNTANVAPFNSCMDESDGYITIFSNPPSPTPIPDSTSMNNGTILNASIWDAIKQYFDSKQQ